MGSLLQMEYGNYVSISRDGKIIAVGQCKDVGVIGVRIYVRDNRMLTGLYLKSTGFLRGQKSGEPQFQAQSISEKEAERLATLLAEEEEKRLEEKYEADQKRRQAEYDALPEEIKLARKLRWFCENNSTEVIAQAPLTAIRAIVEWAIANNHEVE